METQLEILIRIHYYYINKKISKWKFFLSFIVYENLYNQHNYIWMTFLIAWSDLLLIIVNQYKHFIINQYTMSLFHLQWFHLLLIFIKFINPHFSNILCLLFFLFELLSFKWKIDLFVPYFIFRYFISLRFVFIYSILYKYHVYIYFIYLFSIVS